MNSKHLLPLWLATAMILTACHNRPHNADNVSEGDTLQFHHAKLLTLTTAGETTWVSIRDPWDSTRTLHRYQLVPKTAATAVPQDGCFYMFKHLCLQLLTAPQTRSYQTFREQGTRRR